MTILVPFDGTEIARVALERGSELAAAFDRDLLVYSVVPTRRRYAEQKGWIEAGEALDVTAGIDALRGQVRATAPAATFEHQVIEGEAAGGYIARKIRDFARQHDVVVLVLGSESVGRVVTPLTSVGKSVAAEQTYELYLVRSPDTSGSIRLSADDS